MKYIRKDKPININTIEQQIDDVIISFFEKRNIDIYDIQQTRQVPHNIMSLCMLTVYNQLFKPDHGMINNQKSILDYNDVETLEVIANKFIQWSLWFSKSLGIMQFSLMTGIHWDTLADWFNKPESNPARFRIIKNIKECHKMEQISLLNDTPVGALAVANNDTETGLNWSANQALQTANNTVYLIPSERLDKLKLPKDTETATTVSTSHD